MALVSGMRSTLNPNAPLFVPAVYRQVEDFSPRWWELVKTSTWFCDYWLSEHPEGSFDGTAGDEDVVNLLPESFDLGFDEDFDNMEEQFAEIVALAEDELKTEPMKPQNASSGVCITGLTMEVTPAAMKYMGITKFPKHRKAGPAKCQMRPSPRVTPNHAPRRIHQPR